MGRDKRDLAFRGENDRRVAGGRVGTHLRREMLVSATRCCERKERTRRNCEEDSQTRF